MVFDANTWCFCDEFITVDFSFYPEVVRICLSSYVFWKLVLLLSSYWNFSFFNLGLPSHTETSLNRRKNHACPFTKFQTLRKSFNFCKRERERERERYTHIWFKYICIYIHTYVIVFVEVIEYEYLLLIYFILFSRFLKHLFLSTNQNWDKSL